MGTRLLKVLRRLRFDQSGQSLVIVSVAMTAVLGVAALGIDVGTWDAKHHQDQVVADSAALAAANCLANPSTGPNTASTPQCTSSTDTTDAKQVAVSYAQQNGLAITAANVSISGGTVSVDAQSTSPSFFAKVAGIGAAHESAVASAGYSAGSATCTPAAQSTGKCYAIYTANPTCGSNNGWVTGSTSEQITGAIHSQGSLNITNGSFTFLGPITYSSGNCTYTQAGNATMSTGGSYQTPTAGNNQASNFWPQNFATTFPACSSTCTTSAATNGVLGSPSYCTQATTSSSGFAFTSYPVTFASNVYCSIGSGTPSNPATWNGPITFSNGVSAGSSGSPMAVTLIGGYVNATSSTLYLTPDVGGCLVYAVDTDSASGSDAVVFGNGTYNLGGTIFAPNGTINLNSTSATAAFLEAQNVDTVNLSFQGDGPIAPGTGVSATGSDSLTG
jgi:hypothetical protein